MKYSFLPRVNPGIKSAGMVKYHEMIDLTVGAAVDVNNMIATFIELRKDVDHEMCLASSVELNGVPITALRVVAKSEEEFAKTLLEQMLRGECIEESLIDHFDKDGFEVLEFNDRGKQFAIDTIEASKKQKEKYNEELEQYKSDLNYPHERLLYIQDTMSDDFVSVIESVAADIDLGKHITLKQLDIAPWEYNEDDVKDISSESKVKRYAFRMEFLQWCDKAFGRKAIDRKLAIFAGILFGSGLYLDTSKRKDG